MARHTEVVEQAAKEAELAQQASTDLQTQVTYAFDLSFGRGGSGEYGGIHSTYSPVLGHVGAQLADDRTPTPTCL